MGGTRPSCQAPLDIMETIHSNKSRWKPLTTNKCFLAAIFFSFFATQPTNKCFIYVENDRNVIRIFSILFIRRHIVLIQQEKEREKSQDTTEDLRSSTWLCAMEQQQAGLNAHKAQGDFRSSQMYTQQKKKLLTKKNSVCHHWQRDPSFIVPRRQQNTIDFFLPDLLTSSSSRNTSRRETSQ